MRLDYGKEGIEIELDPSWNVTILKPSTQRPFNYPIKKIKEAINNPIGSLSLRDIIESKSNLKSVCIVTSDATRPVPSSIILEALIEELCSSGVKDSQILILIATGLHRSSRDDELERIVGRKLKNKIKAIDHDATDQNCLKFLGNTSDNIPIFINKLYYESDLKIVTGYVEPHFFFGFSGGRKSIAIGIAGKETIQGNHSAEMIAAKYSRFGVYEENRLHKNAMEITRLAKVDFTVNVCINENHEIVKIAAGDFQKAHEKLINYQLKYIFKKIKERYDIVICGNGGYPLDLNLYQAVKSMAIGEMAVKKGGTIIAVNECADGIGLGQNEFKDLIFSGMKPSEIHKKILNKEIVVPDQWEIQILARILMKAKIFVISKLRENEIGNIGLKYAKTVEDAVRWGLRKYGPRASILILPNGPQVLPLCKD